MLLTNFITRNQLAQLRSNPSAQVLVSKFLSCTVSYLLAGRGSRQSAISMQDVGGLCAGHHEDFILKRKDDNVIEISIKIALFKNSGCTDEDVELASSIMGLAIVKDGAEFTMSFYPTAGKLGQMTGYRPEDTGPMVDADIRLAYYMVMFNGMLVTASHVVGLLPEQDNSKITVVGAVQTMGPFELANISLERELHELIQASPAELGYRHFQVHEKTSMVHVMGEEPVRTVDFQRRPVTPTGNRFIAVILGGSADATATTNDGIGTTIYQHKKVTP